MLMLASSFFHWLISLSFLLVRIVMMNDRDTNLGGGGDDDDLGSESVTVTCEHSIIAI